MGLSEAERVCKHHPFHDQRLGVCPSCLREKLSQLYVVASTAATMVGPSYSSSASFSSSTHMSPVRRHQRNGSDLMGSMSFRISWGNGLKKSKSIAFVPSSGNQKKRGFWSKILHPKDKKEVNFDGKIRFNSRRLI